MIWKRLYSSCSGMDTGTLFQLRNLINRRNVITDISKDRTACEEFMQLATIAHVMSAAIQESQTCLNCPQRSCQVISLMAGISCCGNKGLGTRLAPPCARNGPISSRASRLINIILTSMALAVRSFSPFLRQVSDRRGLFHVRIASKHHMCRRPRCV